MKIELSFDDDDVIPCVCKVRPILTAFPQATLVVDSSFVGRVFAQKLQRAQVPVEIKETP
jgi:hypothetical protein